MWRKGGSRDTHRKSNNINSDQLDPKLVWMKCQGGDWMTLASATYIEQTNKRLTKEDKGAEPKFRILSWATWLKRAVRTRRDGMNTNVWLRGDGPFKTRLTTWRWRLISTLREWSYSSERLYMAWIPERTYTKLENADDTRRLTYFQS